MLTMSYTRTPLKSTGYTAAVWAAADQLFRGHINTLWLEQWLSGAFAIILRHNYIARTVNSVDDQLHILNKSVHRNSENSMIINFV